ncbi:MAG: hypothetical protein NVSMB8_05630 [Candidatus Limnocylindrales bacterium]
MRNSAADGAPSARSAPVRETAPRAAAIVPVRRGVVVAGRVSAPLAGRGSVAGAGRAGWVARRVAVRERDRCLRAIGETRIRESLMFRAG